MRERPSATELLEVARETLLDEVLDALPGERRYAALMIANAIAIAARETAAGQKPLERELARLCSIYREPTPPVSSRDVLEREILAHNLRLAYDIRAGRFERQDSERQTVWAHLLETARTKLRESNPRYLQARGP